MRKIFWIIAVTLLSSCQQENVNSNVGDEVYPDYYDNSGNAVTVGDNGDNTPAPTYQTFYDQLSPYGTWVNYPAYGYMWVPAPSPDFSPYLSNGHWVYSDYGWTWVSDYEWGWAPFHYGRWFYDGGYGWMWAPGYDWAPAWVMWGDYGGYYCWAPVQPGIVISAGYRPPVSYWYAVPHDKITQNTIVNHVVKDNADIVTHVNIINNAGTYRQSVFLSGPKAAEVEKYTGQPLNPIAITTTDKPGKSQITDGKLNIYRPGITRTNQQPAPGKVTQPNNTNRINTQPQPANMPPQTQPQRNNNPAPQRQPDKGFIPTTPTYRQPQQQPQQQRPSYQPAPSRPSYQPAPSRPSYQPQQQQRAPSYSPAPRSGGVKH